MGVAAELAEKEEEAEAEVAAEAAAEEDEEAEVAAEVVEAEAEAEAEEEEEEEVAAEEEEAEAAAAEVAEAEEAEVAEEEAEVAEEGVRSPGRARSPRCRPPGTAEQPMCGIVTCGAIYAMLCCGMMCYAATSSCVGSPPRRHMCSHTQLRPCTTTAWHRVMRCYAAMLCSVRHLHHRLARVRRTLLLGRLARLVAQHRGGSAMRCDAMRCDAMLCHATRCDAMRCYASLCHAMLARLGDARASLWARRAAARLLIARLRIARLPACTRLLGRRCGRVPRGAPRGCGRPRAERHAVPERASGGPSTAYHSVA